MISFASLLQITTHEGPFKGKKYTAEQEPNTDLPAFSDIGYSGIPATVTGIFWGLVMR